MADDLDFDALEKLAAKHAKVDTGDDLDFDALERAHAKVQTAPTDYGTTTATNKRELGRENMRSGREAEARSESLPSLAFGAARGATLGMVDRAVSAGTSLGERMAATPQNPADPNAGLRARAQYLGRENEAKEAAPGMHFLGEMAGGAVPAVATGGMNRFAQAATLGGVAGAGNTVSNEPGQLLKGGALGAGGGLFAEGTLGSLLRGAVRGAPERDERQFMQEVTRAGGDGEGAQAMLARNKEELVRERDGLAKLSQDPEIRKANSMTEGKGIPVVNKRITPLAEENANLYGILDHASATGPNHVGQMTSTNLLDALEAAKARVSAEGAARIEGIRNDLAGHIVPRVWKGEEVIPAGRLREWLTSVQDSAARVPGSLNATKANATTQEASREAKRVVNEYFDSIGAPDVVAQIRANNEDMRPLLTLRNAMQAKSKKETLETMGLSQVAEAQTRKLEMGAALASAASGHPEVAAAIVARPYATGYARQGARAVNRAVLAPLERAARAGDPLAAAARGASEALPQIGERALEPSLNPQPQLKAPAPSLRQAFSRVNPAPSDYGTSTAVR